MSGAGVPFASFPGTVTAKGTAAHVAVHFDANVLASDRSQSILLGLHALPTAGSSLVPNISKVGSTSGRLSRFDLPQRGSDALAKSMFITSVPLRSGLAQDISVDVTGLNSKLGGFNLEVFLPGDANGDGRVDATDLAIIDGIYGSAEGQSNFNPAADFNGDGHVGGIDRQLVVINEGAHFNYRPAVPVVTPTVAPVIQTPATLVTATIPVVATIVAPAPVDNATPTVTPVVAVPTAQVATTSIQANPSGVAVQATPTVIVLPQTTPPTTAVSPQAAATSPVLIVPVAQATYPAVGQPNQQVVLSAPVYYSQPASQPTNTVSLSGQAPMPGFAYYYGQPVVQAPNPGQTAAAQSSNPVSSSWFD